MQKIPEYIPTIDDIPLSDDDDTEAKHKPFDRDDKYETRSDDGNHSIFGDLSFDTSDDEDVVKTRKPLHF